MGFKLGPKGPSARAEDLIAAGVKGPGLVSDRVLGFRVGWRV